MESGWNACRRIGRNLQGGFPGICGAHKCLWSAGTRGVWGHAFLGKFCISDLVRSFLVHFGVAPSFKSHEIC